MSGAATRVALRWAAIVIAVAALVDPAFSIDVSKAAPVVVVNMTASGPGATGGVRQLFDRDDVTARPVTNHRVPCAPDERCVVVVDGSVDAALPTDLRLPVAMVTVTPPPGPNVVLREVSIVTNQHPAVAGAAAVVLGGTGVAGRRTEVRLTDGDTIVGSSSHEWKTDGDALITVPWWPIAGGPRVIRAHALPVEGEIAVFDNAIDAGVSVSTDRLPVLVFDPRPSWGSTFVRRALEDDPRFLVEHRTALAPAISTGTPGGRLDEQTLDAVGAVVIGAAEALGAAEVALVERYVRVRGGTAILLPERALSGPATRLIGSGWRERLTASPEMIGPLLASEILSAAEVPVAASVLGHSGDAAAIVVSPTGNGRVIISGAMDAWRFRDAGAGAFDRFWRSVTAEAAAAGAGFQVAFDAGVAAAGTRQQFSVRHREMTSAARLDASAVARCDAGEAQPIRLWPTGQHGVFIGELAAGDARSCTIEAAVAGRQASAGLAIRRAPQPGTTRTLDKLSRDVLRLGGVVADERDLSPIATRFAQIPATERHATAVRPMQSPWWILPFAGCLSLEWWLRRRSGLH